MKFLLFNVVVAGALVFLFSDGVPRLDEVADRAGTAAAKIKSSALEAVEPRAAAPGPSRDTPAAGQRTNPNPSTGAAAEAPPPVETEKPDVEGSAVPEVAAARKTPPALPPDVARRRAEVLEEVPVKDLNRPGGNFMSAADRKRDLILLSEEMELFSAKAIGR